MSGAAAGTIRMTTAGAAVRAAACALLATVCALALLLALVAPALGQGPAPDRLAPARAAQGSPLPEPSYPQINPVSDDDSTTVRPDDDAGPEATVAGLPTSGTGPTVDGNDTVRQWTTIAMLALALNAAILLALASHSLRRR